MKAKILMAVWVAVILGLFGHIPARAHEVTVPTETASEQIIDGSGTLYEGADEWA